MNECDNKESVLLSCVLPAYNVSQYIYDCVMSIIGGGMEAETFEIIVVDDGSTDDTAKVVNQLICDFKQYNIKLVRQENKGVSATRNRGFLEVTGKYVWFIDPDDMIEHDILRQMKPFLEKEDKSLFILDASRCEDADSYHITDEPKQHVIDTVFEQFEHCGPWSKIVPVRYLKENNIRFSEKLTYGEDFFWNFLLQHCVDQFEQRYFIHGKCYYYRKRQHSLTADARRGNDVAYVDNMVALTDCYNSIKMDEHFDTHDLDIVIIHAAQSAVFGATQLKRSLYKSKMKEIKEKGLYPYPVLWDNLKTGVSRHNTICKHLMFLLPFWWYADLLNVSFNIYYKFRR